MVTSNSPSWSTVSYVKDTPENIRLFVSYHLGIGATRMRLFFDDPNDPCVAMLAHLEQVTTYVCDQDFWVNTAGMRAEPQRHAIRQNTAATVGYQMAQEDWVLHLDADEFLLGPVGDPIACVKDAPLDALAVRLRPAERVLVEDGAGYDFYRLPMDKPALNSVHKDFAINFVRRQGFFGHLDGKSFIRSGQSDLLLKPHWADDRDKVQIPFHNVPATHGQCLLHRNAESYEEWRKKLGFRLGTSSIPGVLRGLLNALVEQGDEQGIKEAHQKIFGLSAAQALQMNEMNKLFALDAPIDRFVSTYFNVSEALEV